MENQYQKWVNLSYLFVGALLAYLVFALSIRVVGIYDLETRIKNIDLVIRGISAVLGGSLFFILLKNDRANQFMNEVMAELVRVTWPTQKETSSSTFVVIIMVVISGMVLGFLDYLWTILMKSVL